MWLPAQAQTALISAVTAAVITMLVEYLAKPGLEARKDRILEVHRARRETATQLLNLIASLHNLYGLTRSNPLAWAMGKSALQGMTDACDRLSDDLPRYEFSLPKRQRDVVGRAVRAIGTYTVPLQTNVLLYEKTGILDQERERGAEELPMGSFIEGLIHNALHETARAYTALMLSRRRPLKYYFKLRQLADGAPPLPDSATDDESEASKTEEQEGPCPLG
ncbi:hypothetical protein H7X46_23645 [Pseudonocardia sp. C8]|uniref:Uncharacterized protein n=1 Tax=Saccharopolyspora cebuensis TaxID=418759 RepID=A0ABV4CPY0_9PSEU|nr:hypothetical protein [Pseudonocardia sp. C8]MBC3194054.1 hypothetical protein [Pseudonocardia sp. C8]